MTTRVYTIGHSTHPIEEFVAMLGANGIQQLIDVRTVRGSRRNPQFGEAALAASLPAAGIEYAVAPGLGGRRYSRAGAETVNGAWRNASFRAYADYMQTPEFADALEELIETAKQKTIAIMCAEAVPWRCHRSLIGDALLARGIEAHDVFSRTATKPHALTKFARVEGTRVWYPPED